MTTRCQDHQEALVEGAIAGRPADEDLGLRQHLRDCAACAQQWSELQSTVGHLTALATVPAHSRFRPRLESRLDAVDQEQFVSLTRQRWGERIRFRWSLLRFRLRTSTLVRLQLGVTVATLLIGASLREPASSPSDLAAWKPMSVSQAVREAPIR